MNKRITELLVVGLILWNLILSYYMFDSFSKHNSVPMNVGQETPVQQTLTTFETDFTKVVKENASKVVGISTNSGRRGSGAIYQVTEQGVVIVTNYQLIQNASLVDIIFANGEIVRAEIVGFDALNDVAVLRVKTEFDVEPLTVGNSANIKVGEWALVLGKPTNADLSGSVTVGIISGKDNALAVSSLNNDMNDWQLVFIQANIQIDEDNIGGPVLNIIGEMIGLNTLQFQDDVPEGKVLVIPSNELVLIVSDILENGKVLRPAIGVFGISIKDIPTYARSHYDVEISMSYGIVITSLSNGGIERSIGLKERDILLAINDENLDDYNKFRKILYGLQSGDVIFIRYQRNGQVSEIEVVIP